MGIYRSHAPTIQIDADTIRIDDLLDTDLSHYFEITIDDVNHYTLFSPKIGDIRIMDPDGSADYMQITTDPAGGKFILVSSNITDDNLFEIDHNGTLVADADMQEINIDLAGLTINDGVGAVTLYGIDFVAGAVTATGVDGSTLVGARFTNPTAGEYLSERGIQIICDKSEPDANNAITLETSRDISGTLTGADAITNYSVIHGQAFTHTGGNFVGTSTSATSGVMQLNMDHSLTVNTTADDVYASTALDINVTSTQNSATAQMQCGARALDINYLITNTAGTSYTLNDAIDVARIVLDSAGAAWVAGASCDWDILEINGNGFVMDDDSFTLRGLNVALATITDTDFEAFYGINVDMPAAYQGTDPTSAFHATGNGMTIDILHEGDFGIELETDVDNANNAMLPIYITKDMNITVADAGGAAHTNSGNTVDITIDTYSLDTTPAVSNHATSAVGMHVYQRHRQGNANDVGNIDETFSGATIDLDQILTINNTNVGTPTIATTAPFIDMDLDVTETAGSVTIGAVDWVSLSVDGGSVVSAAAAKMIALDSSITLNHANAEFYGIELDTTGMTDTTSQADSVGGIFINDDGILDYGIKATNATDTLKFLDTENSRGIYIDMDTAASDGIVIESDVSNAANTLQSIVTSRNLTGVLSVDRAMSGYSVAHSTVNDNTATGDFDLTYSTGGIMSLTMQQTSTCSNIAKTDPDIFAATALLIDVDAFSAHANTTLDVTARALDMQYTLTETSGILELNTTDIARILLAGEITDAPATTRFNMFNIDGGTFTINDADVTLTGLTVDMITLVDTDFTAFYGISVDMPVAYQGTDPQAAIRCTGNAMIVETIVEGGAGVNDSALKISGTAYAAANDWLMIQPSVGSIVNDVNNSFIVVDLDNLTINDAANTPTLTGYWFDADDITETDVGNTTIYGVWLDMPDMSTYAGGAAINANEGATAIVEILPQGDQLIALSGTSITARNWLSIVPSSATIVDDVNTNYIFIDAQNLTINDGANTPELTGLDIDFGSITATAVDGTVLNAIDITMPTAGDYGTETAIDITCLKSDVANDAVMINTNRTLTGAVTADRAFSGYSVTHAMSATNTTAGDFDINMDGGIVQLVMAQTSSTAIDATNPDSFSGTALYIDIDALTDTNANAELDCDARALDIDYTLTETLGTLRLAATDIARITATIPAGITSAAAFNFDMFEINGDNITLDDTNNTFAGINIDFSGLTDTSSAKAAAININVPDGRIVAVDANARGTISGRIEQGAAYFEDDFWGRATKTQWTTRITTGAVGGAPTAGDLNGVLEILTGGAATNEESLDFNDIFEFDNTLRPTFECRLNLAQVDNDTNVSIGLINTNIGTGASEQGQNLGGGNEDFILFQMSHTIYTDTNWHLHCQLDGVSTVDAGAAAAGTTWVTLRFEFYSDTAVEWFIDGTSQGTISTNVPTDNLQPLLYILTDAVAAKSLDVDYVKIWTDRD